MRDFKPEDFNPENLQQMLQNPDAQRQLQQLMQDPTMQAKAEQLGHQLMQNPQMQAQLRQLGTTFLQNRLSTVFNDLGDASVMVLLNIITYSYVVMFTPASIAASSSIIPTIGQFLITIGLSEVVSNFTQQLPNYVKTGYQRLHTSYETRLNEPLLRLQARWNSQNYYALAQFYKQKKRFSDAVTAFNKVPQPNAKDFALLAAEEIFNAEQLLAKYRELSDDSVFPPKIYNYLSAQGNLATCRVAIAMSTLPKCKTPAEFAEVKQLLALAKPTLDQIICYPMRMEDFNFYRHVEWQVANAKLLIFSGEDPQQGLQQLFYMLFAQHAANPNQLGHFADDNHYYPSELFKLDSLLGIIIPAIKAVSSWLQNNCLAAEPTELEMYKKIASTFTEKLQFACKHGPQLLAGEPQSKQAKVLHSTIETLYHAYNQILPSLSQLIMRCTLDPADAQKTASEHKAKKEWPLAYVYYRTALALHEKNGMPTTEFTHPNTKAYYRIAFNCGVSLEQIADNIDHPRLRLTMLERANELYNIAKKAGEITCSDSSTTKLTAHIQKTVTVGSKIEALQKQFGSASDQKATAAPTLHS